MERLKAWRKDWWKRLTASALFLALLPVLVTHASLPPLVTDASDVPPVDPDAKAVANEYYWREKLAWSEAYGDEKDMAFAYEQLIGVYSDLYDLDQAEAMTRQALAIHEELDDKRGMAHSYDGLARLYSRRDDVDQAEAMFFKAQTLYQEIGMPHKVKRLRVWLDRAVKRSATP